MGATCTTRANASAEYLFNRRAYANFYPLRKFPLCGTCMFIHCTGVNVHIAVWQVHPVYILCTTYHVTLYHAFDGPCTTYVLFS